MKKYNHMEMSYSSKQGWEVHDVSVVVLLALVAFVLVVIVKAVASFVSAAFMAILGIAAGAGLAVLALLGLVAAVAIRDRRKPSWMETHNPVDQRPRKVEREIVLDVNVQEPEVEYQTALGRPLPRVPLESPRSREMVKR